MTYIGQMAAIGAAMMWTITSLMDEHFTKGVWGASVNYFRLCLGLVLVSMLSFATTGQFLLLPAKPDGAIWFILSGLVAFAMGDSSLLYAFQELGARITLLIFSLSPVLSAAAGYFLFHETLSGLNVLGMLMTLSGLILVIMSKDESGERRFSIRGVQAAVLASFGQAGGIILSKLGLETFAPIAGTQIRLFSAIVGLTIFFTLSGGWKRVLEIRTHPHAWKAVLADATLATLVGVSLSMFAIKHVKAAIASTLMSIMPVLIIPISIWLKERIHSREIVGAFLSVSGIVILFL